MTKAAKFARLLESDKIEARRIVSPKVLDKKPHEIYKQVLDTLSSLRIKDDSNIKELAHYFSSGTHLVDKDPIRVISKTLGDKQIAKDVLDSILKLNIPRPVMPSDVDVPEADKFNGDEDGHLLVSKLYFQLARVRPEGYPLKDLERLASEILLDYSMGDEAPYPNVTMEITTQDNPFIVGVWDKFHKDYSKQMNKVKIDR